MKIYKYEIPNTDPASVEIPVTHIGLKVGEQDGKLFFWALVNPHSHTYNMQVKVVGTGWDFDPSGYRHLGTVLMKNGLVWHIFAK